MPGRDEPPVETVGVAPMTEILERTHAEPWDLRLISPSPVEGRVGIEIREPDGARRRYALPDDEIEQVAALLATLEIDAKDLVRAR